MTALVTPTQLRAHVETDLTDAALQTLIDDADATIVAAYGPHTGEVEEWFSPGPGDSYVFTSRPIASVTSIVETHNTYQGETPVTLGPTDYAIEAPRQVRRVMGGTWSQSSWAAMTKVTYTPVSDVERRTRVEIDLVRLAIRYEALSSSKLGDVAVSHVDYDAERDRLLSRLGSLVGSFA